MSLKPVSNSLDQIGRRSLQLILLLGLVSALGDVTYETGRSVSGPYLALLGASAAVVGLVSGLGEFLGYALRLVSGYLVDRSRSYWLATFIGYGLILSIPLLAFTGRWEWAALCLLLERIGKAIRSPARDTILSYATHQTGRGWGFAIHEALDQVGAVAGPLLFSAVFAIRGSYQDGFSVLWVPAILMLLMLLAARLRAPAPEKLEVQQASSTSPDEARVKLPPIFRTYALFTFLAVAGFANFQVIAYHLVNQAVLPVAHIPLLYAGAMAVDALAALVIGRFYDRVGLRALIITPMITLFLPLLVFSSRIHWAVSGVLLWGVVMAVHETIMRAGIADLIPAGRRATAYGIFNLVYGGAWFAGSAVIGWLYQMSLALLFTFVMIIELLALLTLICLNREAAQ